MQKTSTHAGRRIVTPKPACLVCTIEPIAIFHLCQQSCQSTICPAFMPRLSEYLRVEADTSNPPSDASTSDASTNAAVSRLAAAHEKRVRDHGPRMYRHEDGSLLPIAPPPNPLAVANRKLWRPLVEWCNLQDSGTEAERTRRSLRMGVGARRQDHAMALQVLGLKPEFDMQGTWVGYDPAHTNPLADPQHVLSTASEPASGADPLGEGVSRWALLLAEAARGVSGRA